MPSLVKIRGTIGREPVVRTMKSGGRVFNASVTSADEIVLNSGATRVIETFIPIVLFDADDQVCELQLGDKVEVQGTIRSNSWQAQDGTNRRRLEVHLTSLDILERAVERQSELAFA